MGMLIAVDTCGAAAALTGAASGVAGAAWAAGLPVHAPPTNCAAERRGVLLGVVLATGAPPGTPATVLVGMPLFLRTLVGLMYR